MVKNDVETLVQLSQKHAVSKSTIQRKLKSINSVHYMSNEEQVVGLMDATYWGRNFGVLAMKDSRTKNDATLMIYCKKHNH